MANPNETLIRERAYSIWLREGCPTGDADRHWHQAKEELATLLSVNPDIDASEQAESDHAPLVAGPEARSPDKD